MGLVQWGSVSGTPPDTIRPIRVGVECQYSDEDGDRDSATFIAGPDLGSTPLDVHVAILRLMEEEFFEVPVHGQAPMEMCRETVRSVTVW